MHAFIQSVLRCIQGTVFSRKLENVENIEQPGKYYNTNMCYNHNLVVYQAVF